MVAEPGFGAGMARVCGEDVEQSVDEAVLQTVNEDQVKK